MSKISIDTIKPLGDRFVSDTFMSDKLSNILAGVSCEGTMSLFFEASLDGTTWTKISSSDTTFDNHEDFNLRDANPKLLFRINFSKLPTKLIVL